MDEQVGERTHSQERLGQCLAGSGGAFCREAAFVYQEHMALDGLRKAGSPQALQEIFQGGSAGNGRSRDAVRNAVVPHGAASRHHHLLLFVGFFAVEGEETALQAGGR